MSIAWQVEIDPYCNAVLAKHWPNTPRYGDITKLNGNELEPVDLICGGFPCQDISVAGRREGIKGERSGLWFEMLRIIRQTKPRWVLVENVRNLLSIDAGGAMLEVLRGFAEAGYDVEWDIVSAADLGAWHRRERIFILAHTNSDKSWMPDSGIFSEDDGEDGGEKEGDLSTRRSPLSPGYVSDPDDPGRSDRTEQHRGFPASEGTGFGGVGGCGVVPDSDGSRLQMPRSELISTRIATQKDGSETVREQAWKDVQHNPGNELLLGSKIQLI